MNYKEISHNEMIEFLGPKFVPVVGSASTREFVYDYRLPANTNVVVRVFTSIHKDTSVARRKGADAIRICAVNLARNQGWIRTTRVLRVEGWANNLHRAITKTIDAATDRCNQNNRAARPTPVAPVQTPAPAKPEVTLSQWTTAGANEFVTEASSLDARKAERPRNLCPRCNGVFGAKNLIMAHVTADEDQEITHWEFQCPHCKAHLTVFND